MVDMVDMEDNKCSEYCFYSFNTGKLLQRNASFKHGLNFVTRGKSSKIHVLALPN